MPALANIRHERFVRHYLKTGVAAQAYLAAGYKPTNRNSLDASACQLLRSPKVQSRIGEFRRQMTYKTRVTLEKLLDQAEEARALAMASEQPAAAIQATTLQAKLVGLLVDRKETGQPGDFSALNSQDEVLAKVRAEYGDEVAKAVAAIVDREDIQHSPPGVPRSAYLIESSSDYNGLPN
jgi:hypothetical protein